MKDKTIAIEFTSSELKDLSESLYFLSCDIASTNGPERFLNRVISLSNKVNAVRKALYAGDTE